MKYYGHLAVEDGSTEIVWRGWLKLLAVTTSSVLFVTTRKSSPRRCRTLVGEKLDVVFIAYCSVWCRYLSS